MNTAFASDLFRQTLTSPREAAQRIIGLGLERDWLWTALILMGVLNGLVYSLVLQMGPGEPSPMMPALLQSPLGFTIFLIGALVLTVLTLTLVGRLVGGRAELPQILALIAWMQFLRLVLQIALVVLMLALPLAGLILVLVASVWGLVILVVFVDEAHGLGNVFKAAGVIILGFLGMLVGLSAILGVLGALVMGGA
ncbi:Yip1 family protein [Roseovarius aquimarinus]|uniref:Yip1 family protein n=1 Tax=Roseovarius aquimarinus TaxID=1229156 RepID=A0ABW7I451_9RHOB